jgi:DNA-binding NtrC family response regulator
MNAMPKVMVVDDEQGICKNVEKILKKSNYDVSRASSAKEALEIMSKESFNLLISDIVMPEMNGLELLKTVKNEWPVTKAVMMTAFASTDTAVKAIRLGALDYIPKPFTPTNSEPPWTKPSPENCGRLSSVNRNESGLKPSTLTSPSIPMKWQR